MLCTTTTLGNPNLLLWLTGGRFPEVTLCDKNYNCDPKNGCCYLEVVVSSGMTKNQGLTFKISLAYLL